MPNQGEGRTLGNTEVKFFFLTTHKTVTYKLFDSPRSYFCIVTACAGWWPLDNGKTIIFYELDYHYCHYYDL